MSTTHEVLYTVVVATDAILVFKSRSAWHEKRDWCSSQNRQHCETGRRMRRQFIMPYGRLAKLKFEQAHVHGLAQASSLRLILDSPFKRLEP